MQSFLSCLNNYNGFPDFEDTLLISICPINRRRQFPSHDRHRIAIRMLMRPNTIKSIYSHFRGTNQTRHFAHNGVCLSRVLRDIWWTRTIMPFRTSTQHRPKPRCSNPCRNITSLAPITLIWPGINSKESPPCNYIHRWIAIYKINFVWRT